MQAFNPVHLQHLRSSFAILAEGIGKDEADKNGKALELPFQFKIDHNTLQSALFVELSQPKEDINTQQLARLIETQEKNTQGLQSIAAQLLQLTQVTKQLKQDSDFFSVEVSQPKEDISTKQLASLIKTQEKTTQDLQFIAAQLVQVTKQPKEDSNFYSAVFSKETASKNLIAEKVEIGLESSSGFDFELPTTEGDIEQSCQAYFSRLPWSSEMFAALATKMRESKPRVETLHIMQLATDSALKTAAEAVSSSEVSSQNSQNFLFDDSWLTAIDSDFTRSVEPVLEEKSVSATENLFQAFELETQHKLVPQNASDYFSDLPWVSESETQLSADYVNDEQNSAIEMLFTDSFVFESKALSQSETPADSAVQICGDYFQSLPWVREEEIQLSADYVNDEQNSAVEMLFTDSFVFETKALSQSETPADSAVQICGDYFQSLPWVREEESQLSVEHANLEQESVLDMSFLDESVPSEQDFFQHIEEKTQVISQTQDCRSYFQALPWTVKKSSLKEDTAAKFPQNQNQEQLQTHKALGATFTNKAVVSDLDFLRQLEQETEKITKLAPDTPNYF